MSEPRYISPLLDGFSLGHSISDHHGVECYPAMYDNSDKRFIVKKISLPASQDRVDALLLTGVFRDVDAVLKYYEDLALGVRREVETLNSLAEQRGFVPVLDCQIVPMESGVGFEVHILSRYRKSLDRFTRRNPMTHLSAVNLGIDLCAAMAVCREAGWLYVDLKPENIFLLSNQEYRIGDLGFIAMDSLQYASLPDRYRSIYTAPEVVDAYASLNATMDTYALGLVLYQIYNCGSLPFDSPESRDSWLERLSAGEPIAPPCGADEEMTEIIRKACALNPADRWQTPAEMGHALISYMQRNGAEDIPIAVAAEPEAEEQTLEETTEAPAEATSEAAPEDNLTEETPAETAEETSVTEESPAEGIDNESSVEEFPVESNSETSNVEESSSDFPEDSTVLEGQLISEEAPAESKETESGESESRSTCMEEIAAESSADSSEVEKNIEETSEESSSVEDNSVPMSEEAIAAESTPAEPEEDPPAADWIDLMDAFLAEEEGTIESPTQEGEPTLRELMSTEELPSEVEELHSDELSEEAADILNAAQELIEHEAPTPVIVPDPIDVPIPEPILPESEEAETEEESTETTDTEDEAPQSDVVIPAEPSEKRPSILWKIFKTVTALALVAGLAYGGWYYYQNIYLQAIDAMEYQGSADEVIVTIRTNMDESELNVICKDTYGNAVTGKLENGAATFSGLVPNSQYIISLEPVGFHKLTGATSVTYSTPAETKLMHLTAVTGQESGSAIISFGIEGPDSEEWTMTCEADGQEPQTVTFTGHTVTFNQLTIGTEYTFTLTVHDDVLLVGENSIVHTAGEVIQASDLALSGYADGAITVSWTAPEGVERWIVRCFDDTGYDQLQEIEGNTAVFQDITEGRKYTVEVIAANQTLGIRSEITAQKNSISDFAAALNGSMVELSWNTSGEIPCTIACGVGENVLQVITPEENKATYGPVAPGTTYTFTIKADGSEAEIPGGTVTVKTPAAGSFSAKELDSESVIVEMYNVPNKSKWNYDTLQQNKKKDSFKTGGSLALLYTVTKPYNFGSEEFETLFVIRNSEGTPVSTASRTRVWNDMWDNGYCTEQVNNLPSEAGKYTLSIYIANGLLAELAFTVN